MELFPLFQTHLSKIEISHHTANPNLQRQPCVSVGPAIAHLLTFLMCSKFVLARFKIVVHQLNHIKTTENTNKSLPPAWITFTVSVSEA